ncbi:MAG: N-acetylmuramoyl-L-alanine amidase [Solirubrobacterales bacterium]
MRIVERPSPNFEPRRADVIDMLVLHYTGMESGRAALERLCAPEAKVSSHYLIEEDGTVFALVPESERAWHAGAGSWRGHTDVNSRSIGIELVNPGHEFGYRPFPAAQIDALIRLCVRTLARHPIPARNVVAHSDIAPTRKQDPGELFPWERLKGYGIGLWPFDGVERAAVPIDKLLRMLERWGYDVTAPDAAIAAFQRHFRPERVDGVGDEQTAGRLARLLGSLK